MLTVPVILFIFSLILSVACSRRTPSFADGLAGIDAEQAVALSKARIDSLAQSDSENLKPEIQAICEALAARGDREAAMRIAVYPYGFDPDERPDIAERLLTSTLLPGKQAPEIQYPGPFGMQALRPGSDGKYTVLFFYESTCRSCQGMIGYLTGHYQDFRKAGVRIVTLSSDQDGKRFEEYAEQFPWPDKLCDLRGYGGQNFIRYGVAATPTLFLIDRKGTVVGQFATPEEIGERLRIE